MHSAIGFLLFFGGGSLMPQHPLTEEEVAVCSTCKEGFSFHMLMTLTEQVSLLPNQGKCGTCVQGLIGEPTYLLVLRCYTSAVQSRRQFCSPLSHWSVPFKGPKVLVTPQPVLGKCHYLSHYHVNLMTDISLCTFVWTWHLVFEVFFFFSHCSVWFIYEILRKK